MEESRNARLIAGARRGETACSPTARLAKCRERQPCSTTVFTRRAAYEGSTPVVEDARDNAEPPRRRAEPSPSPQPRRPRPASGQAQWEPRPRSRNRRGRTPNARPTPSRPILERRRPNRKRPPSTSTTQAQTRSGVILEHWPRRECRHLAGRRAEKTNSRICELATVALAAMAA